MNFFLQNKKPLRRSPRLEAENKKSVIIKADPHMALDEMRLVLYDSRDGLVFLEELAAVQAPPLPHTTQLGTRPAPMPQPQGHRGGRGGGGSGGGRGGRGGRDDRDRGGDDRRPRGNQPNRLPPPREREPDPEEDRFDIEGVVDSVEDREQTIERAAAEAGAPSPLVSGHASNRPDIDEIGEGPQDVDDRERDDSDVAEPMEDDGSGPGNERHGAAPVGRDSGRRGGQGGQRSPSGQGGPGRQGAQGGQGGHGGEGFDDQSGGPRRRRRRGRRGRGGRGGAQGSPQGNAQSNAPALPFSESAGNDDEPDERFDEADDRDRSPAPVDRNRAEPEGRERDSEVAEDVDAEVVEERADSASAEPSETSEQSEDGPRRRTRSSPRRPRPPPDRISMAPTPRADAAAGDQDILAAEVEVEAEKVVKPARPARDRPRPRASPRLSPLRHRRRQPKAPVSPPPGADRGARHGAHRLDRSPPDAR